MRLGTTRRPSRSSSGSRIETVPRRGACTGTRARIDLATRPACRHRPAGGRDSRSIYTSCEWTSWTDWLLAAQLQEVLAGRL